MPPPNQCTLGVSAPTYAANATMPTRATVAAVARGRAAPVRWWQRGEADPEAEEHRQDHRGAEVVALEEQPHRISTAMMVPTTDGAGAATRHGTRSNAPSANPSTTRSQVDPRLTRLVPNGRRSTTEREPRHAIATAAPDRRAGPRRRLHDSRLRFRDVADGKRVRVGVLAPMKSELRPVVKAFGLKPAQIDGVAVHTGTVGNADVVATTTGIGTALATRATERLLRSATSIGSWSSGSPAASGPSVDIGDIVIPEVVVDGTTGNEYRPAPIDGPAPRGSIVTSDDFIVDPERLALLIAQGVIAVDMETGSVAAVCAARGVAWSTVRAISDRAEDGDVEMVKLANPDGSPNAAAIAKYFAKHPGRIPYMVKVGRGALMAAKNAAEAAARACAQL